VRQVITMNIYLQPDPKICEYFIADNGIASPFLIDLPHGGNIYPDDFDFSCSKDILELCEEKYLDELFLPSSLETGGVLLKANFPRTYVDVNRSINDIDQLLLDSPWKEALCDKPRSKYGHGVVMRLIRDGDPIYSHPLRHDEIHKRLNGYYSLYHNALNDLSNILHEQFRVVYHINVHSMPSSVVENNFPHLQPDFILGDLDGRSCGLHLRQAIADKLKDMGYRVAINQLYKGAEIIHRYGQPAWGRHSLQIEINRALFQNEISGQKNKNFTAFQKDIGRLVSSLISLR